MFVLENGLWKNIHFALSNYDIKNSLPETLRKNLEQNRLLVIADDEASNWGYREGKEQYVQATLLQSSLDAPSLLSCS